jgi:molecular chaperone DnaJ
MFHDIFGGGGGGRRRQSRGVPRGYDLETEVEITLKEVLTGTSRDVEFKRLDVCTTCAGSGARPGTEAKRCETCAGQGQVAQTGLGGMFRMVTTCPHCRGRGKVVVDKCADCRGNGRVPVKRKLAVKIPAGIHDGQAIRVASEGEPPGPEINQEGQGIRGDLHVIVRVKQHDQFERDGDDLVTVLPIAFAQAALGADVEVPTLNSKTNVAVPAGTQHGALFRVAGHGLPNLRGGKRGDLVAIVQLIVPRRLSDQQRDILKLYAQTEEIDVKAQSPSFWDKLKGAVTGNAGKNGPRNEDEE